MVEDPWGRPVDPEKVESAFREHPDVKLLSFVHAETSTGTRSDAETLIGLARERGCLTIVDTVTSLGGIPLEVDAWGADAVYSGSQKCLSCPPGLSPVTFSARAVEAIKTRRSPIQSWFMDTNLVMGYWGGGGRRSYHHTAPVNALYALHESLLILLEEGLEEAWARHDRHHRALRAGLEAMGLELFVEEAYRLPQLNSVSVPDGVDEAEVRQRLLEEHQLEIGAGLGELAGRIWRIGLMGHSCNARNVLLCLVALEEALAGQGARIERGVALASARRVLGA
jgi:alanine-glyoxylate transaminase/serine-glyoxylate transaminase/serine-pyruvate transaminase